MTGVMTVAAAQEVVPRQMMSGARIAGTSEYDHAFDRSSARVQRLLDNRQERYVLSLAIDDVARKHDA